VLKPSSTQSETYDVVARPIIQDVLDGFNGVIMAYG
jgi:kinesin family protein 5